MKTLLKNANCFTESGFIKSDLVIDGSLAFLSNSFEDSSFFDNIDNIIDCTDLYITPGFTDVHVHFREPGFFMKETIKTGSMSAAKGGYVTVCTMPNLNPPPNNKENLQKQMEIIKNDSCINIVAYATITQRGDGRAQIIDMDSLKDFVAGYTDDGRGVQSKEHMFDAMTMAKEIDKMIVAHCEDESLLNGGYIHDGEYARKNNHKGICSESEWIQVQRDVELAKKTGVKYHVCHISTKETVDIIRRAKKEGVDVTCETAPHYLILCDEDLKEEGRYKMNPPIRAKEDRDALIQGIVDGTIDMIATDHAPHTDEEKSRGLEKSPFGIVGLEFAFSLLYTHLVDKNIISLEKLMELMCINPMKRFELDKIISVNNQLFENNFDFDKKYEKKSYSSYYIYDGMIANLNVLDLKKEYVIDSKEFLSKGKATPFDKEKVKGQVVKTFVNGKLVYGNF